MKFVLTNDDGIDAPGLLALRTAVAQTGRGEVVIVAPADAHSGCSHRVTTDGPIRLAARGSRDFSVAGKEIGLAILPGFPETRAQPRR